MIITAIQLDIHWLDAVNNCERASKLMDMSAPDTDLFVLPEMWSTGFNTAPTNQLVQLSELSFEWMQRQARLRDAAVAGSLPVCLCSQDEQSGLPAMWYNRFFFVFPDGTCSVYDKRNLFTYGGEQFAYASGTERVVVSFRGVRFLPQVCFDLRFPETSRNELSSSYDVLLYVANWPKSRRVAWDALLQARAIENQAYVLGVNRTGIDSQCVYNGGTAAFDAYGACVFRLDESEQVASFSVDLDRLHHFRQKFQVLK